jgi:hypothetical protein
MEIETLARARWHEESNLCIRLAIAASVGGRCDCHPRLRIDLKVLIGTIARRRIELKAHGAGLHIGTFLHAHDKHHAERRPKWRKRHQIPASSALDTVELRRHAVHAIGTGAAVIITLVKTHLLWRTSKATPRRVDCGRAATTNLCETATGWRWRRRELRLRWRRRELR